MPVLNHPNAASYDYHLKRIAEIIRLDGNINDEVRGLNYIFIMFTNRSGSNFLSECISSSGNYNLATEFLNYDVVEKTCEVDASIRSFGEYFSAIALSDNVDGTFCAKLSCEHLFALCATGIMTQIMENSTFVLIERSDKVDQAISFDLAVKSNIWSSYWERAGEITQEEIFDVQNVFDGCYSIIERNNIFEMFIVDNMAMAVKVLYEDVVINPETCLARISEKIGKPIPYIATNVEIKKQADRGKTASKSKLLAEVRSRLSVSHMAN